MNELKPEDVMKALECCLQADGAPACYKLNCPARLGNGLCYYEIDCEFNSEEEALKKMLADALALLREKDAEIERLRAELAEAEAEAEKAIDIAEGNIRAEIASCGTSCHWCEDKVRADTVRKMQDRVQAFLTDEETDAIISEGDVFIPISAVRKIAKETLEGK